MEAGILDGMAVLGGEEVDHGTGSEAVPAAGATKRGGRMISTRNRTEELETIGGASGQGVRSKAIQTMESDIIATSIGRPGRHQ
jgi:hypothetical protein